MKNILKHMTSGIRRKVTAVLLVAAAFVLLGVFLVFQCLSFDESGAHVIDRYGVLAMEAAGSGKPEEASQGSGSAPQENEQPEAAEPTEPQEPAVRAAMLSANALTQESTVQALLELNKKGTLDTVIVNLKDEKGNLNIPVRTRQIEDIDYLTERKAEALADSIETLKNGGIHVAGRIYCMHDQRATGQSSELAMQFQRGGTWLDYDRDRWLDITNRSAVDYIADIAKSAVKLGCDEILLEQLTFPIRGHMDKIEYASTPKTQTDVMLTAIERIRKGAGDGIAVSLSTEDWDSLTTISDMAVRDGIPAGDTAQLFAAVDRVYTSEEDTAEVQRLAADADVRPVFDSVSEWTAYTGDAVLEAVHSTEQAIAILSGEQSGDIEEPDDAEYDDSYDSDEDSDDYDDFDEDSYDDEDEEDE